MAEIADRRRRRTRAAIGATALLAIVAVVAGAMLRDDGPAVVLEPGVTEPGVTEPAPATTVMAVTTSLPVTAPTRAPTTAPAGTVAPPDPPAELSAELLAWRDARVAEGMTTVHAYPGQGTTARMLGASVPGGAAWRAAVLLDDGRVVDLPADAGEVWPGELYSVGGDPAVIDRAPTGDGTALVVRRLDPATETWSTSGDIGLGPLPNDLTIDTLSALVVGDLLLVGRNTFEDRGDYTYVPAPDRRGVIVHPDLSITPIADAPDGIPMTWNVAAGGAALQMYGPNLGSIGTPVWDQPWSYLPATNEWSEIALPDWFDCADLSEVECQWIGGYDIGSIGLLAATDRGVVAWIPDGTVGLYDPTTNAWRRMDDAPFELAMPAVEVVGDQVIVAPWRSSDAEFGQIGVLDVATATWESTMIEIPAAIEQRFDEWFDVRWELRPYGSRVMAAPRGALDEVDTEPVAVYDASTRRWETPTEVDTVAWDLLDPTLAV